VGRTREGAHKGGPGEALTQRHGTSLPPAHTSQLNINCSGGPGGSPTTPPKWPSEGAVPAPLIEPPLPAAASFPQISSPQGLQVAKVSWAPSCRLHPTSTLGSGDQGSPTLIWDLGSSRWSREVQLRLGQDFLSGPKGPDGKEPCVDQELLVAKGRQLDPTSPSLLRGSFWSQASLALNKVPYLLSAALCDPQPQQLAEGNQSSQQSPGLFLLSKKKKKKKKKKPQLCHS
jgi:hypothetical protein